MAKIRFKRSITSPQTSNNEPSQQHEQENQVQNEQQQQQTTSTGLQQSPPEEELQQQQQQQEQKSTTTSRTSRVRLSLYEIYAERRRRKANKAKQQKQQQELASNTSGVQRTTTTSNNDTTNEALLPRPSRLAFTLRNHQSSASNNNSSSSSSSNSGGNKGGTANSSSSNIPNSNISGNRHHHGSIFETNKTSIASNLKTRTITTNSSTNKTFISTALPPYEIEVTEIDGSYYIECPLCVLLVKLDKTPDLQTCDHRTCLECMQRYLKTEINHSRLNITCPICSEPLLQNVIKEILKDDKFYAKYESFMLRKVLAAEPDARWCPAPDCGFAVLANGCASCPRLVCGRKNCNTAFCYHCKQEWHPNQTCSSASIQRNKKGLVLDSLNIGDFIEEAASVSHNSNNNNGNSNNNTSSNVNDQGRKQSRSSQQQTATLKPDEIKECPVCSSRIVKMNDGSCNHMTCSICETEFCWLCMKEINDLHYFSPSGCTFWGKKPWSRKKKLFWRLGMLIGAPVCIFFIAGIAVPAIVIGIPVWAARKLHTRLERKQFSKYRKNAIVTGGVLLSFVVSPIISAMALAIGIPILLGYVYGVVPLSLCRSSGGCLSSQPSVENIAQQFQPTTSSAAVNAGLGTSSASLARRDRAQSGGAQATDVISIVTANSHKIGNPSIGETSLYMSNISLETNSIGHITNVEREDRESASNAALAGSIMSSNVNDDGNSTRALAGSIISKESGGYTLIPAEVHSQQQANGGAQNHQQQQQVHHLAQQLSTASATATTADE